MWAFAFGVIAISRLVSSQHATPVPVTGVLTGIDPNTGARPARLHVNELYNRRDAQWDLYVQALLAFQEVDETDELSYFQIAAIHGLPFVSWNGAEQVPDAPTTGYCPHSEITFPTWHRPFVALFEQRLVFHAQQIAKGYTSRTGARYQAAAGYLRLPYWDWATDHNLPLAAIPPNHTISGPNGSMTIRNPLYSYRFQKTSSVAGLGGGPLARYSETVRCPLGGDTDDATLSDAQLNDPRLALTSQTYAVFTQSRRYDQMASASIAGPSFEAPHNNIHNSAGCPNGTLADLGWSAFDPLFMLHHANVDRLIAMWQAIHYNDSTMNTTELAHGTFGTKKNTTVDADSPLKPFFDAKLNYYTSKTASRIKDFGYTYPEINDWSTTREDLARYVTQRVNDLYGQGTDAEAPGNRRDIASQPRLVSFSAEMRVERSEVPLPCTINLRLGDHVLGRMSLLGMPTSGMSYATIPLRDAIQQLNLKSMSEDTLVPYLQQNLEVEVQRDDGTILLPKRRLIPSLSVELQGRDVVPRTSDDQLPKYGVPRKWPVTKRA